MSFLIGENMTGGYGATDILHGCTIAAEQGDKAAQTARTQLAAQLTAEQLAASKKLAKEWQDGRGTKPSASAPVPEPQKTAGK